MPCHTSKLFFRSLRLQQWALTRLLAVSILIFLIRKVVSSLSFKLMTARQRLRYKVQTHGELGKDNNIYAFALTGHVGNKQIVMFLVDLERGYSVANRAMF
jgi:hypothetical protein